MLLKLHKGCYDACTAGVSAGLVLSYHIFSISHDAPRLFLKRICKWQQDEAKPAIHESGEGVSGTASQQQLLAERLHSVSLPERTTSTPAEQDPRAKAPPARLLGEVAGQRLLGPHKPGGLAEQDPLGDKTAAGVSGDMVWQEAVAGPCQPGSLLLVEEVSQPGR